MAIITEDILEQQAIEWFKEIGYEYKHGNDIAPDSQTPERDDFRQVILEERLRSALIKINPSGLRCITWNILPVSFEYISVFSIENSDVLLSFLE